MTLGKFWDLPLAWAWDRIALLKYGVDDIQLFFQGDVRFLRQWA